MKFRMGELFSGPGGIGLGAAKAKVRANGGCFSIAHAWANDNDADSCETYRRNICPKRPRSVICDDVRKFDLSKLSPIEALAFGFPCNDFSVVGEKRGMNGVYGPLYSYGIKALNHFKPMWFFAENVRGLRSVNDGLTFQIILEEMSQAGYTISPHLYRFEEYGVPQARHRIVIIGIRSDLSTTFRVPAPLSTPFKTCGEAISQPPIPPDAPNNEYTKQSAQVVERLTYIKPGENAFTADIPEHLRMNVKNANISTIYKRLDPEKPAYTVTGSGGGGTHVYHWSENRALTNRERARLQTFPDAFIFGGSKESVRKQIGMAMPPAGAQVVFEAVLKSFAGISYSWIEPNIEPRPDIIPSGQMHLKLA